MVCGKLFGCVIMPKDCKWGYWYQNNFTSLLFLNMLSGLHFFFFFWDMTIQKWVVTFWTPCIQRAMTERVVKRIYDNMAVSDAITSSSMLPRKLTIVWYSVFWPINQAFKYCLFALTGRNSHFFLNTHGIWYFIAHILTKTDAYTNLEKAMNKIMSWSEEL